MITDNTFKIWYDDQPNDIIDRLIPVLKKFNISLEIVDSGDGFIKYEIIQN